MNLKSGVEGNNGKLYGPVNARRRRKILRISKQKVAQKRFGNLKDNINGSFEMISKACVFKGHSCKF